MGSTGSSDNFAINVDQHLTGHAAGSSKPEGIGWARRASGRLGLVLLFAFDLHRALCVFGGQFPKFFPRLSVADIVGELATLVGLTS